MMKEKVIKFFKSFFAGLTFLFLVFSSPTAYAVTELTENTDLSALNLYQFTLTQANMEVLSQSGVVERDYIPASGNWVESTVFSLRVDKSQSRQTIDTPIKLRFNNAGMVNGKVVDVYVTFNSIDAYRVQQNADYYNPNKTVVPFLTIDENWGTKSIQIMDFIWAPHPNLTKDMYGSFALDANVTAELKYQDGTPTDLKMVMLPSDIDVVTNALGREETFSIFDNDTASSKIIKSPYYALTKTVTGNKTTWHPTRNTGDPWSEHNISGFAVRSETNAMHFESTTTAVSGSLFGFYVETPKSPVKQVSTDKVSSLAGQAVDYTAKFTMPTPGKDIIGSVTSMQMIETFDDRLDFQSLSIRFDGRTLSEGGDYSVSHNGQKVTVTIASKYLTASNAGKEYTITYKTKTNSKIVQNRAVIENQVTHAVDNILLPSNKVTTNVLFKKTHQFISGTPNKNLPTEVLNLLPQEQNGLENGTRVTPEPPKGNKTKVSVADGNWTFQSYDKSSETIQDKDAHFIGTWTLEEYEAPVKEVFNSDGINIDNQEVKPGDELTYKITYKNTTDSNKQVTITDVIPNYTEYVRNSSSHSIVQNKRWLKWTATVPKDKTVTIQFKVKVDSKVDGQELNNTATVTFGSTALSTNTTKNKTPFKKYVLPETGGQGTIYYLFGGAVLTTISALWLIRRFKQTMTS